MAVDASLLVPSIVLAPLTAVQSDLTLQWDVENTAQGDLALQWDVLSSAASDAAFQWDILSLVESDVVLQWDAVESVLSDAALQWHVLNSASVDLGLVWIIAAPPVETSVLATNVVLGPRPGQLVSAISRAAVLGPEDSKVHVSDVLYSVVLAPRVIQTQQPRMIIAT